jgi:hypothetical protein
LVGTLLQLILLALAAQAQLRGDEQLATDLLEHQSFSFATASIRFTHGDGTVSNTPAEWLDRLERIDACSIRLRYFPSAPTISAQGYSDPAYHHDHRSTSSTDGFGRPVRVGHHPAPWAIEVISPSTTEFWWPHWSVISPRPSEGGVWRVEYTAGPYVDPLQDMPDSRATSTELELALVEVSALSNELGESNQWKRIAFAPALEALRGERNELVSGSLPNELGISTSRQVLLTAAARAWVFGGMGSWNDMWFEDDSFRHRYEAVTSRLYAAISFAFVAAANDEQPSTCPTG